MYIHQGMKLKVKYQKLVFWKCVCVS